MILPSASDAIHKSWMYRILTEVADDLMLVKVLRFKGGTCAAMRGLLNRFSVDLDFDLVEANSVQEVRVHLERIFEKLGLEIKDSSERASQYFLKYSNKENQRSIVKIDVSFPPPQNNRYEPFMFADIDKLIVCQTPETMFSNKIVALYDRYQKNKSIAGRDLFDIQSYYLQGITYHADIIEERTKMSLSDFFRGLKEFVNTKITQRVIDEDLNPLLLHKDFQKIRKHIKNEVLMFINQQVA